MYLNIVRKTVFPKFSWLIETLDVFKLSFTCIGSCFAIGLIETLDVFK